MGINNIILIVTPENYYETFSLIWFEITIVIFNFYALSSYTITHLSDDDDVYICIE